MAEALAPPFNDLDPKRVTALLQARRKIEREHGKATADNYTFLKLCEDFLEGRESLADLVERLGWINAKDRDRGESGIIQVRLYWEQRELCDYIEKCFREDRPCEVLILKSRQLGMSTLIQIIFDILSALLPNSRALTVAHKDEAVEYLRDEIAVFALEHMRYAPEWKKVRGKLIFHDSKAGKRSIMRVESAQSFEPGRTMNFRFIHLSEAAMYPNDYDFIAGVTSTLPEKGFYVLIQETTARGPAGQFYDAWVAAIQNPPKNGYKPLFFPWWKHVRYRMPLTPPKRREIEQTLSPEEREWIADFGLELEQIYWYRMRRATRYSGREWVIQQEMPTTWEGAFLQSGRPVFDRKVLLYDEKRLRSVEPVFRGNLILQETF